MLTGKRRHEPTLITISVFESDIPTFEYDFYDSVRTRVPCLTVMAGFQFKGLPCQIRLKYVFKSRTIELFQINLLHLLLE